MRTPIFLTMVHAPSHSYLMVGKTAPVQGLKATKSQYSFEDEEDYYFEQDCDAVEVLEHLRKSHIVKIQHHEISDVEQIKSKQRLG